MRNFSLSLSVSAVLVVGAMIMPFRGVLERVMFPGYLALAFEPFGLITTDWRGDFYPETEILVVVAAALIWSMLGLLIVPIEFQIGIFRGRPPILVIGPNRALDNILNILLADGSQRKAKS